MSDWLQNFILYLGAALIVISMLFFLVFTAVWRKRTSDSFKKLIGISSKVGKSVTKSGKDWYVNRQNKKPVSNNNQLPGGIRQVNNPTPVFTPNKQPKKEVIIDLNNYAPSEGTSDIVFKYMDTCLGYTIFDEGPNGESLAFKCVGGKDKKGNYTIWFYDVRYHKDARKETRNNDYSPYERSY